MTDYKILSATSEHCVAYHPAELRSGKLIVTFAPINERLAYAGFGTKTALSLGYDTIYVGSHHRVMHRSLDIETVARLILPVAAGREIIAYGASAGAYAALYFGGQLNAKIIGFSPRLPVHPYLSGNSEESVRELRHTVDLKDVPRSAHKPVIIYDPLDKIDAKFADQWALPGYPDAHVCLTPIAGHGVISRLRETGGLKDTVRKMFEGHIPKSLIVWNENHHNYHYTKGFLAAQDGNDHKALDHFSAALKIAEHRHIYRALIQSAKRLGRDDLVKLAEKDAYRLKLARRAAKQAQKAMEESTLA